MARPRTPTNVLELRGAFKKHAGRREDRADEPQDTEPLGPPPEHLDRGTLVCWEEIVSQAPAGVFKRGDRMALELAAFLMAKFRNCPIAFGGTDFVQLRTLLSSFGMTPADRSRVGVTKEAKKKNPFADL